MSRAKRFTPDQAKMVRHLWMQGSEVAFLADLFKTSKTTIFNVCWKRLAYAVTQPRRIRAITVPACKGVIA